jgi:hypothetical protein
MLSVIKSTSSLLSNGSSIHPNILIMDNDLSTPERTSIFTASELQPPSPFDNHSSIKSKPSDPGKQPLKDMNVYK